MPTFQYVARTFQGKTVSGNTEGTDEADVARTLREQGLVVTAIEAGTAAPAAKGAKKVDKGKGGGIKSEDIVIMSRQFATMIKAGLPLMEVLNILANQADKKVMKKILSQVERDVETGSSLTEAIQKHPKAFDNFFISMVKAGEAAGMLDTILEQVAHYAEKTASIQRKVKSAVMYPAVVSVVAIGITSFLMVKVVPVFVDMFSELGGDLPLPTKITMAISDFMVDQFVLMVVLITGSIVGVWKGSQTPKGKRMLDQFKLNVPIFGPLFLKVAVARFTRSLGTLLRAGVNILNALEITSKSADNVLIEEVILATRTSIQSGENIATPLAAGGIFPPMVVRMIEVGERTGALETMLSKIADFYEDQVDAAVSGLTSLIEPILMVCLGFAIGFIVISMFMPMFAMIEEI